MDQQRIIMMFPDIESEELYTLQTLMQGMDEMQQQNFLAIYKGRRREKNLMLILTLLGFFGIAGIQRFLVGDIGMGILYFFTAGLCFIGTIVDLINISSITLKYNQQQAAETTNIVKMVAQPYQPR